MARSCTVMGKDHQDWYFWPRCAPGTSSYSNPVPKKSPIGTSTLGSVSPFHVHPEHQLAQMKGTGRVDGEPNMPDGACPVYIRELDRGLGLHFDPVRIAAGAVGT